MDSRDKVNKNRQEARKKVWMEKLSDKLKRYENIDPVILSYAAGLFDGEGCVIVAKGRAKKSRKTDSYNILITVGMSVKDGVDFLYKNFGGRVNSRSNGRFKPIHVWQASAICAEGFLRAVLPYLLVKKKEAEVAIEFRDHINSHVRGGGRIIEESEVAIRENYKKRLEELKRG